MLTLDKMQDVGPLQEANACLDDPIRLKQMWDEKGYLFFRNMLDREAIDTARMAAIQSLIDLGVVDSGATEPSWNGSSLETFPFKIPALETSHVWEDLVAAKPIHDFVSRVIGDDAYFLPMSEYRVTPPEQADDRNMLMFQHQDQFLNPGIPFLICWIPLSTIDVEVGGLAMAEQWHDRGFLHDPEDYPRFAIKADTIPDTAWRRADCGPGDIIFFNRMLPHSGIRNFSNQFRLSLDIRVMRGSDRKPIIGKVIEIGTDSVTVEDDHGARFLLKVEEDSMIRDPRGRKLTSNQALQAELPLGMHVVVGHEDGTIRSIRARR